MGNGGGKVALYLVGLLAARAKEAEEDDKRLEDNWKDELAAYEAKLPEDPSLRTPDQWEHLVHLTGEAYYAMGAHSTAYAAAGHVQRLQAGLEEALREGR